MKIVIAGSNTRGVEEQCYKHNLPKLYSMLDQRKSINEWNDDFFLIADSGAYTWNKTAMLNLKRQSSLKKAEDYVADYFQYVKDNKHRKIIFIEFDAYFDLPKELINEMYYEIIKMEGLKSKFCRVYHPTLDNGSLSVLKQWIEEGQDYIFIAQDSMPILDDIFALTKDKVKVHGLAMTKLGYLERYPFFSVDSTSPLSTVIFGRYSRPIMAFSEREDIFKAKSIECYDDDYQRLEKAIIETKKTQDYITELWTKRGITWEDLKY